MACFWNQCSFLFLFSFFSCAWDNVLLLLSRKTLPRCYEMDESWIFIVLFWLTWLTAHHCLWLRHFPNKLLDCSRSCSSALELLIHQLPQKLWNVNQHRQCYVHFSIEWNLYVLEPLRIGTIHVVYIAILFTHIGLIHWSWKS